MRWPCMILSCRRIRLGTTIAGESQKMRPMPTRAMISMMDLWDLAGYLRSDEVAVYDIVLPPDQIGNHYRRGIAEDAANANKSDDFNDGLVGSSWVPPI